MARTKAPAPVAPTTVVVANHYSGIILFPKRGEGGVALPPVQLHPGQTTEVDAETWTQYKKNRIVQHWLDTGTLTVGDRKGPTPVAFDGTEQELEIPEHLQGNEQEGGTAKAAVRKTDADRAVEIK